MLNKGQASSAVQGKSQLLQGSGKRLPHPSQCWGVFQRFLLRLSNPLGADRGCREENTLGPKVWSGVAIHMWLPPRASHWRDALRWEQSHVYLKGCSSKPRAEVQKQQQQPRSLQLRLVFHSQGKVDLKAFVSLGRGWKQTKKREN